MQPSLGGLAAQCPADSKCSVNPRCLCSGLRTTSKFSKPLTPVLHTHTRCCLPHRFHPGGARGRFAFLVFLIGSGNKALDGKSFIPLDFLCCPFQNELTGALLGFTTVWETVMTGRGPEWKEASWSLLCVPKGHWALSLALWSCFL